MVLLDCCSYWCVVNTLYLLRRRDPWWGISWRRPCWRSAGSGARTDWRNASACGAAACRARPRPERPPRACTWSCPAAGKRCTDSTSGSLLMSRKTLQWHQTNTGNPFFKICKKMYWHHPPRNYIIFSLKTTWTNSIDELWVVLLCDPGPQNQSEGSFF